MSDTILRVENLQTHFTLDEGVLKAVDGVDLEIQSNKTLGVIGESGCGKSVTAQSILRIVPSPGRIVSGSITLRQRNGQQIDLASVDPHGREIRRIRGREISMIFQEPMTSLSPVHTVGDQIVEMLTLHTTHDKQEAREIATDMLAKVGISNTKQRLTEYPHQLSGGLRQRVMIAMALSCHPALLIADEPTTALDVTVQAQILDLIRNLQEQFAMAVLYITHDLGVIAEIADSVAVIYLGKVVEMASVAELFERPLHPYTRLLLKSIPRFARKRKTRLDAIRGNVPVPLNLPAECGFRTRCPSYDETACAGVPPLVEMETGHFVRCHRIAAGDIK